MGAGQGQGGAHSLSSWRPLSAQPAARVLEQVLGVASSDHHIALTLTAYPLLYFWLVDWGVEFALCTRAWDLGAAEAAWKVSPRDREIHPSPQLWQLWPSLGPAVPSPDVPASELHELLSRKLAQCGVMFDFLDCVADLKGKEVKRAALNELVECVGSTRGVLIEPVYPDIIRMVSTGPASGDCLGDT